MVEKIAIVDDVKLSLVSWYDNKVVNLESRTMTEAGIVKAQSDNLPKIDAFMMIAYFASNPDFTS